MIRSTTKEPRDRDYFKQTPDEKTSQITEDEVTQSDKNQGTTTTKQNTNTYFQTTKNQMQNQTSPHRQIRTLNANPRTTQFRNKWNREETQQKITDLEPINKNTTTPPNEQSNLKINSTSTKKKEEYTYLNKKNRKEDNRNKSHPTNKPRENNFYTPTPNRSKIIKTKYTHPKQTNNKRE